MLARLLGLSRVRLMAALVLFSLVGAVGGVFQLPPLDRDESRFAQASKQMLESGDFIDIRFQDEPRYKKPAGAYWAQSLSAAVFERGEIWSYRLPSALAIAACVVLVFLLGELLFDRRTGALAALLFAAALIPNMEARQAKSDALQLVAILSALYALARVYLGARWRMSASPAVAALFWVAIGAGVLIKGPVTPFVAATTLIALSVWDRSWQWLRGLRFGWGVPLALLVAGPWLVAIGVESGGAFFQEAVGRDLGGKLISGQEAHGAPPGYFLLLIALTAWPAAPLFAAAARHALAEHSTWPVRFCLAWIVPAWLVFELVPTKLPHYTLPLFAPLFLLAARAVLLRVEPGRWGRLWLYWCLLGSVLLAAFVIVAPLAVRMPLDWVALIPAAFILLAGWTMFRAARDRDAARAAWAAPAALAGIALTLGLLAPRLDAMWIARELRAALPPERPVALAGYSEPSAIFLLGTDTIITNGAGAAERLRSGAAAFAAVDVRHADDFTRAMGGAAEKIGEVRGLNYSNGRALSLSLYRLRRP